MSMTKSGLAGCIALLLSSACLAQFIADDPDWKEVNVPAPPAFDLKRLVPVEVSARSQLKWGVDPASIQISSDGVVRYVVVAQSSSGVVNAMYEGLRCKKGEFRRYAWHSQASGWISNKNSEWASLRQTGISRHPAVLARLGLCDGAAPATSPASAAQRLRAGSSELVR